MSVISFALFAKAAAIGLLGAAPMGPSGVLVIRKTLDKGRFGGFLTGLGVMLSDMIYIAVTMTGLSLVLGYLENPRVAMAVKMTGCVLLMFFGISTIRNNPLAKTRRERNARADSIWQNVLSGFLVAVVNPLVVFIYMGLFAFFALPVDYMDMPGKLEMLLLCVAGDVCWWLILSFLINKLRNRFDLRGVWMINRILGTILIAASAGWFVILVI